MKLPARYMFTSATIACIAFLLAASVTIYFWIGAIWGVVIFLVTMAPIVGYAALGGFFLDPTKTKDGLVSKDAPRLRNRVLGMVIPLLTASVPFIALLGSWHTPTARAAVGAAGGGLGVRVLAERALGDVDPMVARAGCRSVIDLGSDKSRDLILARLYESDDEGLVRCLLQALPSDMSGQAGLQLQMLASKWEGKLWQEGLEPERACALSDHLKQAERAGVDLAAPRLLACAVGAPELASRQCCAQSLRGSMGGAPSVAAILPTPERATETSGLVRHAELLIESPRRADPEVVAILGLDEPEYEAWSLGIGCESLRIWQSDVRKRAGRALAARLKETCDVEPPAEEDVAVWTQTCAVASEQTVDPARFDDAICSGLNQRFMQQAMAIAKRDVSRARNIAAEPPQEFGFLEAMMGMMQAQDSALPGMMSEGVSGMGMGGIPKNLNVLDSPAFKHLNTMPEFRQLLKAVGSKSPEEQLDAAKFHRALQQRND